MKARPDSKYFLIVPPPLIPRFPWLPNTCTSAVGAVNAIHLTTTILTVSTFPPNSTRAR
jgi:hypothetical protein